MSSRIFQSVIVYLKEATDRCFGAIDSEGFVVACSELSLIGSRLDSIQRVSGETPNQTFVLGNRTYKILGSPNSRLDYAVFVEGKDNFARSICIMAAVTFNEAKLNYDEKFNKTTFVKNIISDNILPGDVYVRAKDLDFVTDVPRVVYLIRQIDKSDIAAFELVKSMFPDRQKDFVLSMSETDIVLVKEIDEDMEVAEICRIAEEISGRINTEFLSNVIIGIGSIAKHLRELADRYKEAQTAIEVGQVFDTEKSVVHYENLGIGRIIYQLPTTLCEMYLKEVFKKNPIETLDQETLYTINKFFENNLNVSETSRKLFVHRNTLVYRLEKIKKLTGLDLREFDHAIVFKVALMVKKYLISQTDKS